jgi:hypothetical protein
MNVHSLSNADSTQPVLFQNLAPIVLVSMRCGFACKERHAAPKAFRPSVQRDAPPFCGVSRPGVSQDLGSDVGCTLCDTTGAGCAAES